jgi:hypothetical protein
MTDTASRPAPASPPSLPPTAAAAVRENALYAAKLAQRAAEIRADPQDHRPRLVLSRHVRGESILDRIADVFAGNIVGFDKTPWPLLLTILNLPQLSIMISLQVSANRAQTASDKRAIADHETLIALHEMAKQQLDILHGQDQVLGILENFASKDMPGRQAEIMSDVKAIMAKVGAEPVAG